MERVAVGLEPIPEGELVIGILHRIDQARYGHVRLKFLENQRLKVSIFSDRAEVIWKEIKDTQAVAYNSASTCLELMNTARKVEEAPVVEVVEATPVADDEDVKIISGEGLVTDGKQNLKTAQRHQQSPQRINYQPNSRLRLGS